MIEIQYKSCRSMLVEVIVKSFIPNYLFDSKEELKKNLQEKLNLNLKFDTNVSDLQTKNNDILGQIYFNDENGVNRIIDFIIISSSDII